MIPVSRLNRHLRRIGVLSAMFLYLSPSTAPAEQAGHEHHGATEHQGHPAPAKSAPATP